MDDVVHQFLAVCSFLFGLAFGSFLNVCIYRFPREISVVLPDSKCPSCRQKIQPYDNIPVLSWLMLRGKCRNCGARITPRYLIVELLTGILFLYCFLQYGISFAFVKYATFGFLLLGLIFTDAEWKLLPDKLTIPGIWMGFIFSLLVPIEDFASSILEMFSLGLPYELVWRIHSLADSLLGAAIGAGFIYGAGALYLRARGIEGMGFGDVKLMGLIGAFIGPKLTLLTLFAASACGSIFGLLTVVVVWIKRTRRRVTRAREPFGTATSRAWMSARNAYRFYEMPFGVFLGSMALVAAFFGQRLVDWYIARYF